MTEKQLPIITKNTSVASVLKRSNNLVRATQAVLQRAKVAKEIAVAEDDSWVEHLFAWADENKVPELNHIVHSWRSDGGFWHGLPRSKDELLRLSKLNLSDCGLENIPVEIFNLPSLIALNLSDNKITVLPEEISKLNSLEELILNRNYLSNLPKSIADLTSLKKIYLHQNNFDKCAFNDLKTFIEQINEFEI